MTAIFTNVLSEARIGKLPAGRAESGLPSHCPGHGQLRPYVRA